MKRILSGWILLASMVGVLQAQQPAATTNASANPPATAATAIELADGEVRRIDKSANKITLRHGTIKSLDMPPMTMVFQVKDPAMLDQVKVGDKIRFAAEDVKGAITLTRIEMAK